MPSAPRSWRPTRRPTTGTTSGSATQTPEPTVGAYYRPGQFSTYGITAAPRRITNYDVQGQETQYNFTPVAAQYVGPGRYVYYGYAPTGLTQYDTPLGPGRGTIPAGTPTGLAFYAVEATGDGGSFSQQIDTFPWNGQPIPEIFLNQQTFQLGAMVDGQFVPWTGPQTVGVGDPYADYMASLAQVPNTPTGGTGGTELLPAAPIQVPDDFTGVVLEGGNLGVQVGGDQVVTVPVLTPTGGVAVGDPSASLNLGDGLNLTGSLTDLNLGLNTPGGNISLGGINLNDPLNPDLNLTGGVNLGSGNLNLTGNPAEGTLNVGGSLETPLGTISGDTNVPDTTFDTSLGQGFYDFFSDPLGSISGALSDFDLSSLNPTNFLSGLEMPDFNLQQYINDPALLAGLAGEALANGYDSAEDYVRSLFQSGQSGGTNQPGTTSTGGTTGGTTNTGSLPGGASAQQLLALLAGVAGGTALGGDGTQGATARRTQVTGASPLLSGQDPLSLGVQGALGRQLTATDLDNNPYIQDYLQAALRPTRQYFEESVMPGIASEAITAGGFGGSRQGVAEGLAAGRLAQSEGDVTSRLFSDFYQTGMGAERAGINLASGLRGGQTTTEESTIESEVNPITGAIAGLQVGAGLLSTMRGAGLLGPNALFGDTTGPFSLGLLGLLGALGANP